MPKAQKSSLVDLIDGRLKALGISERKALVRAGLSVASIQHMRKGHQPRPQTLVALAPVLKVPFASMLDALARDAGAVVERPRPLESVTVIGAVEAGVWQAAIEWPEEDRYLIDVVPDPDLTAYTKLAFEVRGTSMNRRLPPGSAVVAVPFRELGREPREGDVVIAIARRHDEREATVKILRFDDDGAPWLWPDSTDPRHQMPLRLQPPPDGVDEITVDALVVASFVRMASIA